jgi:hypothetical protein
MRYIEEGASYKVKIPQDYFPEEAASNPNNPLSDKNIRKHWDNKEVRVGHVLHNRVRGYYGKDQKTYTIPVSWLAELTKHCSQVERYIESQKRENYVSPFSGKTR